MSLLAMVSTAVARDHEVWASYRLMFIGSDGSSAAEAAMRAGVREAVAELEKAHKLGLELVFVEGRRLGVEEQVAALQRGFVDKVDGVMLVPVVSAKVEDEVRFLTERGVRVVTLRRALSRVGDVGVVEGDESRLGALAMKEGLQAAGKRRGGIALLEAKSSGAEGLLVGARATYGDSGRGGELRLVSQGATVGDTLTILSETMREAGRRGIAGWVFLDEGVLTGTDRLPWKRGGVGCAVVANSPIPLHYLERDEIDAVVMPDYYAWGREAVKQLVEQVHLKADAKTLRPEPIVIRSDNLSEWRERWTLWLR